jgi:hypothetical protein
VPIPPGSTPLFGNTTEGFFGNTAVGFLDYALIQLGAGRACSTDVIDGRVVRRQVLPAAVVMAAPTAATKFGANTGRTDAVFSTRIQSIVIGGVVVTNVLEFKGTSATLFGDNGDSGALVVSRAVQSAGMIIGILIATAPPTPDAPAGRGYVMPFERLPGLIPA